MSTCHYSFILAPPGCSHHSTGKTFYLLRFAIKLVILGKGHYLTAEVINLWALCPFVCQGLALTALDFAFQILSLHSPPNSWDTTGTHSLISFLATHITWVIHTDSLPGDTLGRAALIVKIFEMAGMWHNFFFNFLRKTGLSVQIFTSHNCVNGKKGQIRNLAWSKA